MRSDDNVMKYLKKHCKSSREVENLLLENTLPYHLLKQNNTIKRRILSNRIYELSSWKEIEIINNFLTNSNIKPIFFKGVTLGKLLYTKSYFRKVGDIDLYVSSTSFDLAVEILLKLGYKFVKQENATMEHHLVFNKGIFYLELHRNILNPLIMINENYLKQSTKSYNIDNRKIISFNETATLLHLIYHLYMDIYMTDVYFTNTSLYTFLTKKQNKNRFLYRAYEISLFSEKYFSKINWNEIIKDMKHQKFRLIFKKMIYDIIKIFPQTFPQEFIVSLDCLTYENDMDDYLYKHFVSSDFSETNMDYGLCNYIEKNWEKNHNKNIKLINEESFTLSNPIYIDENLITNPVLNCKVMIKKFNEDLKFIFKVANNDFCFSDEYNYDTQTSDGVHLIICGTQKYSYNSIFLFPKKNDNKVDVRCVDVINNIEIDKSLINASFFRNNSYYTITVILTKKFLLKYYLDKYLYIGVIISDCSNETKRRISQLILSEPYSEWYNPVYFTRINLES